ncbi:hypothetical protein ACYTTR_16060, partial [Cobetia marina]
MLSSSLENAQRALNQQARQRALAAVLGASPASSLPLLASDAGSAPIRYRSQGRTLLIGSEARLRALSSLMLALPDTHSLSLSLLISEQDNSALVSLDERHITTSEALPSHASTREALSLSGHLGHFTLLSGGVNLARALLSTGTRQVETFDLIADLGHQPLNQAELPPPGYLRAEDTVLGELDRLASDASLVESGDQITNLTHWATEFA